MEAGDVAAQSLRPGAASVCRGAVGSGRRLTRARHGTIMTLTWPSMPSSSTNCCAISVRWATGDKRTAFPVRIELAPRHLADQRRLQTSTASSGESGKSTAGRNRETANLLPQAASGYMKKVQWFVSCRTPSSAPKLTMRRQRCGPSVTCLCASPRTGARRQGRRRRRPSS